MVYDINNGYDHSCASGTVDGSDPAVDQIYFITPPDATDKNVYWLLLNASYCLINANWQSKSDQIYIALGLTQCTLILKLFSIINYGKLVLLAENMVDDIRLTGENKVVQ